MSVKERKLREIDREILCYKTEQHRAPNRKKRQQARLTSYAYELYYEIIKNDVAIRAESLSYFTLFSLMPLIAGVFLVLGIISQYTPVQKEFEDLLANFLQAIPEEQRDVLLDYILQFKDDYLAKISTQSASIGVFAFGVLIWVAGKVFFNLEALMNRIWAVKYDRPFFERIRNFIVCMMIMPVAYITALSLPGVIEHFGQKKIGVLFHQVVPILIIYFSLSFIFRYFPNTKVKWRSAHLGALASTVSFALSNFFLGFYFKFGTSTAYGKAAIVPIFAFFIYVSWLIFILGVEVSLLVQAGDRFAGKRLPQTTLAQALILEKAILVFEERFDKGLGPIEPPELADKIEVGQLDVESVLSFLRHRNIIVRIAHERDANSFCYILSKSISSADLLNLIKDFLDLESLQQDFDVGALLNRLKPN